jgi:hypothetical protein
MAGPLGTMNPGEILQAVLVAAGIGAGATAALSEGKDENNPWAICYSSLGIDKKPKEGDANFSKFEACVKGVKKDKNIKESRKGFSIQSALEKMDSIIEEVTTDKVTEILNSLTESEKEVLLSTLKKKV